MTLQTDPILLPRTPLPGAAVPRQAPLKMPTQSLARGSTRHRLLQAPRVYLARLMAFGGGAVLTACGAYQISAVFGSGNHAVLQMLFVILFTITFGWIAFAACQAIAAIFTFRAGPPAEVHGPLRNRTAILMPVYNEDPDAICAALQAMAEGIADLGAGHMFEIFILSDTSDPEIWAKETACFMHLRENLSGRMRVWYRHRNDNTGRKAGNLRDFVERWGARYAYMLVLDADSLMAADTIVRLVRRMDAAPRLGILQTLPALAGGRSLFARLQQFAGRLYGPIIARGVASWQGVDGNYWGHNAIIRTRAFAQCCGLPVLRGRKPFGGHVLSHDFVEAALIRRGGWQVRMDTDLGGSWEGCPPTLLDLAARDRRWAQGNLQHAKIVGARGLSWSNRAHFLIGIGSYIMSPVWLAMLLTGALLTAQGLRYRHEYYDSYYDSGFQLFPTWPIFDAERMMWLLIVAMTLLFLPKILGVLRAVLTGAERQAYGGAARIAGGAALEVVLSALLAPALMLFQTRQIFEILLGRDSGWSAQNRGSSAMSWRTAFAAHGSQAAIGLSASAAVLIFAPAQIVWVVPVLAGLVLTPALSWVTAREHDGQLSRLLHIPEDRMTPPVFLRNAALYETYAGAATITPAQVMSDPAIATSHLNTISVRPASKIFGRKQKPSGVANRVLDVATMTTRAKIDAAHDAEQAIALMNRKEVRALLGSSDLLWYALGKFTPPKPTEIFKRPARRA